MFNETDKEQIEYLKKWWREYGRLLVVAIVVGLAVGYGWQYWKTNQREKNIQASLLFQQFKLAKVREDQQEQDKILHELGNSYKGSAYASFAMMEQSASLIQKQKYNEALTNFEWVRENAKSKHLRDLALIREARLLLAMQRAKDSLNLLSELHESIYQPMADELEGDAYAALGEKQKASEAYQKAEKAYVEYEADNLLINRKANSPVWVPTNKNP